MQSKATTVDEYLASLPAERRAAIVTVRAVIVKNLDADVHERMAYGMIGYGVPHHVYPAGYHADPKQPLPYAALASQKNHMSLYLMSLDCGSDDDADSGPGAHARWFREAWARTGKRLDMGKACIRFKKLDDLALDVLAEAVRRVPARTFIEYYEASRTDAKPTPADGLAKKPARSPRRGA